MTLPMAGGGMSFKTPSNPNYSGILFYDYEKKVPAPFQLLSERQKGVSRLMQAKISRRREYLALDQSIQ